ncbi:MAG: hypothetical protein R3F43_13375 [bacterium]
MPVDASDLGEEARRACRSSGRSSSAAAAACPARSSARLLVIRRQAELHGGLDLGRHFHRQPVGRDARLKGMLLGSQLRRFFPELGDPRMALALAVVHARFSTNTFPSWARAQPLRYVAHNGEINTVGGNRAWMEARRRQLLSSRSGGLLDHRFVIDPAGSDSAQFDNLLELLHLAGRSLPYRRGDDDSRGLGARSPGG